MPTNKPLKRHKALVALSREHHQGLLLCWKLRKGLAAGVGSQRMNAYLQYFYKNHLEPHIRVEEEVIFPTLPKAHVLRVEAESQHQVLNQLIARLAETTSGQHKLLQDFEEKLEKHIRFEERQLFMEIQGHLGEQELLWLGERVAHTHRQKAESWEDRFWE